MSLSPMMKHYFQIKEKYSDCIIFYRLGDFYEMFFDDAIKASAILDLTLTGRDCGLSERAPMCGIPYHAVDLYLNKLVSQGVKVAICEQLTEPNGVTLVERDVIRVVTAGTIIEENLIDEKLNNFIGSIFGGVDGYAFSWADITTGEFYTQSIVGENALTKLIDLITRVSPAEIISNSYAFNATKDLPIFTHEVLPRVSMYRDAEYNAEIAKETLKKQFKTLNLLAYGIENDNLSLSASGALIAYLAETQKHSLANITRIVKSSSTDYMELDTNAIRNLELVKTLRDGKKYGSLLWLLDKTKTSMGARTLQNWILSPLQKINSINYRLDGVKELFLNTLIRNGIIDLFKSVKDIGRLSGKISNGNLTPRDCLALVNSLEVLPSLKFQLLGMTSKIILDINRAIADFTELSTLLRSAISEDCPTNLKDGGYIKEGYNKELDELRSFGKNGKQIILEIEQRERQATGIKALKISFNRVFGYYIEITNSFKELVPYNYQRKQTLSNCERYVTDELKEVEEKILTSEEKSIKLEQNLYSEIKSILIDEIDKLKATASAVGVLDVISDFANIAKQNNYTMPIINENSTLNIVGGRHPVVEAISKEQFVANDTFLDTNENRTMILTGPNMAGKSTYMRQVALITIIAHIGSFVPARSAEIPITDKIFTRVGASDNLILDQSTFMVEMSEVATILLNATKNSLLILDEIGRGTSTFDGLSIAWSVVEYLTNNIKAKTMFATHYHEVSELEGILSGVKNYKVTVKEINNSIVFMRKVMRGGANKSFGIEVAALAGVPKEITLRAKEILKGLEKKDLTKHIDIINNNDNELILAPSEVERILNDTNMDKISPLEAFNILLDLKNKVEKR